MKKIFAWRICMSFWFRSTRISLSEINDHVASKRSNFEQIDSGPNRMDRFVWTKSKRHAYASHDFILQLLHWTKNHTWAKSYRVRTCGQMSVTVTYQNVRKIFEHSRFFWFGSTKMSEKSPSTKMSENEYQNLRKFLLCPHTKKLLKFQNLQNPKYSSESACPI